MRNDQIFVLLLVVLLPMSGCFDGGGVGEAEGAQDSDSTDDGGTSTGGVPTSPTNSNSQERTWYSSGGTYATTWSDDLGVASGLERCMDWGPSYDSQTGEYLGEECRRYGLPTRASDWNVSECTDVGGTPYWYNLETYNNSEGDNSSENDSTNYAYRWAPVCIDIPVLTISTNSGEALIFYQFTSGPQIKTTCDGASVMSTPQYVGTYNGQESSIAPGSAMNCTHELTRTMQYQGNAPTDFSIWSVVYAIQDVTVV